jgi:sarcosine oxidase
LEQYFPLIEPTPVNIFRCIYQKSPDGSFIVDRHAGDERVIVATGFSGTGFKHAPAIGLILTQLANDEAPIFDISELSMKRFQVKSKL